MSMQYRGSVSQRGLLSIAMLMFSVGGLGIAMLAGAKLVFNIFDVGLLESLDGLIIKVIVVGLAYLVGWGAAMLAHIGLLTPVRRQITYYFDRNGQAIRTED